MLRPGDRKHRLIVELGVVNAVQQVDSARTGGRDADSELAGELGVAAGGEGRDFLVARLDEADPVLAFAQRFENAVDPVAGNPENRIDAPLDKRVDENVAGGLGHCSLS
jgi:hypothetical protein